MRRIFKKKRIQENSDEYYKSLTNFLSNKSIEYKPYDIINIDSEDNKYDSEDDEEEESKNYSKENGEQYCEDIEEDKEEEFEGKEEKSSSDEIEPIDEDYIEEKSNINLISNKRKRFSE